MGIIIDLKNAIRDSIYTLDNTINFNFEEIKVAEFPYVFFYIPNYRVIEPVDTTHNSQIDLSCVLEYASEEDPDNADLWEYEATFRKATKNFPFYNTKYAAQNPEFSIVDGALQMRFELTLWVKDVDETELMEELSMSFSAT